MKQANTPIRPLLCVAISPKSDLDRVRLQRVLSQIVQQDSALRVEPESAEGRTVISGMGESHLDAVCNRIAQEYEAGIEVGKPEVVYVETIGRPAEAEARLIGHNQYAHVELRLEPLPEGSGYQFVNATAGGALPTRFVEAASWGIQAAMNRGVLGNEVVDLRAVLQSGSYHEGDSDGPAFEAAGVMAFKQAASKASPVVLEPVMSVEAVVPDDVAGIVIADLSSRRGYIQSLEYRAGSHVICATVPLAKMIGYSSYLRTMSRGHAELFMYFLRYDLAPEDGASGGDEAGVTANKPTPPKTGSGSAAALP